MKKFTIFLLFFLLFVGFSHVNAQTDKPGAGGPKAITSIAITQDAALYCAAPIGFWINFTPDGTLVAFQRDDMQLDITPEGGSTTTYKPTVGNWTGNIQVITIAGIGTITFNSAPVYIYYSGALATTATFEATFVDAGSTISRPREIFVIPPPDLTVSVPNLLYCAGSNVDITAHLEWDTLDAASTRLTLGWQGGGTTVVPYSGLPLDSILHILGQTVGNKTYTFNVSKVENQVDGVWIDAPTCVVTTGNSVNFTVYDPISSNLVPSALAICNDGTTTVGFTTNTTLSYLPNNAPIPNTASIIYTLYNNAAPTVALETQTQLASVASINWAYTTKLTANALFHIEAKVQDGAGCDGYDAAGVAVDQPSVGGTVFAAQTICSGTAPAQLSLAGNTGAVLRWESSTDGTTWTPVANTLTTYTPGVLTATTQYRAVVQNGVCALANSAAVTITVTQLPTVVTIDNQDICHGVTTTEVNLASTPTGATFAWSSTENNTNTFTSLPSGTGNIPALNLVLTNPLATGNILTVSVVPTLDGCVGTTGTFTITVRPVPTLVPVSAQAICDGASTTLATLGMLPAAGTQSFAWTAVLNNVTGEATSGTGNTITAKTLTLTDNTQVGTVTYSIIPTRNGCAGTAVDFVVTVNPLPTVVSEAGATVCFGSTATATATATASTGATILWYAAATGGVGSAIAPTLATLGTSTHYAGAVMTATGCFSATPRNPVVLAVLEPPTTAAAGADQTLCGTIAFTLAGNDPAVGTGTWSVISGPGTLTNAAIFNTTITGVTAGSTTVLRWTIVSNAPTCADSYDEVTLINNPLPSVVSADGDEVCFGAAATASATASTGATILWYTAATGGVGTANVPTETVVGVYLNHWAEAVMTATTCPSSARTQVTLTVNALPFDPTGTDVTECYNGNPHTGSATVAVGDAATIVWYDALTGGNVTTAPSGTAAGTYTAYAEAVMNVTLCPSAARTLVTVTILPIPNITEITLSAQPCVGSNAMLTATYIAGADYTWTNVTTSTLLPSAIFQQVIAGAAADYTYRAVATLANGCTSTRDVTVLAVTNPAAATLQALGTPICNGQYVNLATASFSGTGAQTFDWYAGYYNTLNTPVTPQDVINSGTNVANTQNSMYRLNAFVGGSTDDKAVFALEINTIGYNCPIMLMSNQVVCIPAIFAEPNPNDTVCIGGSADIIFFISNYEIDLPVQYKWYQNNLAIDNIVYEAPVGQNWLKMTTDPALHENQNGPQSYYYNVEIWQDGSATECHTFSPNFNLMVLFDPQGYIQGPTVVATAPNVAPVFTVGVVGGYGAISYQWYLDNIELVGETGVTCTLPVANPIFAAAGQHQIEVAITQTASGCDKVYVSHDFEVIDMNNDGVTAEIVGPKVACVGDVITLTVVVNDPQNITNYFQWLLNGNYITGETGLHYTFTVTDTIGLNQQYTVEVTRDGCDVIITPVHYFDVIPRTVVLVDDYTICANGVVTVTANAVVFGDNQVYRYIWYNENDVAIDTTYVNYRMFTSAEVVTNHGHFAVSAELLYEVCGSVHTPFEITVTNALYPITLISTPTSPVCANTMVLFEIEQNSNFEINETEFGIPTVSWWVDGFEVPGQELNYLNFPFSVDGTHYVYARLVYPKNNCEYTTDELEIVVKPMPTIQIVGNSLYCTADLVDVKLEANPIPYLTGGFYSYRWYVDNEIILPLSTGNQKELTHIDVAPRLDAYLYSVKVTDDLSGCVVWAEYPVLVNPAPIISITSDKYVICDGEDIQLNANIGNAEGLTFQWYYKNATMTDSTEVIGANATVLDVVGLSSTTEYSFIANNASSTCLATSNIVTVLVNEIPQTPLIWADDSIVCAGMPVTLTATDTTTGATYSWYANNVLFATTIANNVLINPTQTLFYTVTATKFGCTSLLSNDATVVVRPAPVVHLAGPQIYCAETADVIVAAVINGDHLNYPDHYTIKWFIDGLYDATYDDLQIVDINLYARNFAYTFKAVVTDTESGCITTAEYSVLVNPTPALNIVIASCECPQTTICAGENVTLRPDLGFSPDFTYTWYQNGVAINNNHTFITGNLAAGTYMFYLEMGSASSTCAATSNIITVTVNPIPAQPILEITTRMDGYVCLGEQIQIMDVNNRLDVLGYGQGYTWYRNGVVFAENAMWYIVDNADATGEDYFYFATVTVNGCVSPMSDLIDGVVVRDVPTVAIAGPSIVCDAASPTVLYAVVNPINDIYGTLIDYTYQWYLNDTLVIGETTNTMVVENTPSPYPYNYQVEVIDPFTGCVVASLVHPVYVNEFPVVRIVADKPRICITEIVLLTATISDDPNNDYQWYSSDEPTGIVGAISNRLYVSPTTTTKYWFTAKQFESDCIAPSDTLTVIVIPKPIVESITVSINQTIGRYQICDGGQVKLTAKLTNPNGNEYYKWFENGFEMEGENDSIIWVSPRAIDQDSTNYWYNVVAFRPEENCPSDWNITLQENIHVIRNPRITLEGFHNVCDIYDGIEPPGGPEANAMITAFINGVSNYSTNDHQYITWFKNGQSIGLPVFTNHKILEIYLPHQYEPYTFQFEWNAPYGCTGLSDLFYVWSHKEPEVNITSTEDSICVGGIVTLTANIDNYNETNYVYQWYKGSTANENKILGATEKTYATPAINTVGNNDYFVIVKQYSNFTEETDIDERRCIVEKSYTIVVLPDPTIESVIISEYEICNGREVIVTATLLDETRVGEITYQWFKNNVEMVGITGSTFTDVPTIFDNDTTTYIYSALITTTASGCKSVIEYSEMLTVYPNPTVKIQTDPIVCHADPAEPNVILIANVVKDMPYTLTWYEDNAPILYSDGIIAGDTLKLYRPYRDYAYNFSVYVSNGFACNTWSEEVQVYVNDTIHIALTTSETDICDGGSVTVAAHLQDWNADQLIYNWYEVINGVDVEIPHATYLSHYTAPLATGVHTFKFKIKQLTSLCEAEGTIDVNVVDRPVVTLFLDTDSSICDGGLTRVLATTHGGVPGGEKYTWYINGHEVLDVKGDTLIHYPRAEDGDATTYFYSAKVKQTATACESDITIWDNDVKVTVHANPTVLISGDQTVCSVSEGTDNIILHANTNVGATQTLTYTWYEDDVIVSDNVDSKDYSTYRPYRDYPYSFSVRITNEYGCQVMSPQYYVSVNDTIEVEITATETEICETGTVTLTASLEDWNADELVYRWFTVVGGVETEIYGATNKTYTVTLNTDGAHIFKFRAHQLTSLCTATDEITINVYQRPVVTIDLLTDASICDGGRVYIAATTTGGVTGGEIYTWYRNGEVVVGVHGDTLIDFPRAEDGDATIYYYQAEVVQTATGCWSNITPMYTTFVTVHANPTVLISGDQTVCSVSEGTDNIILHANTNVGADQTLTYTWYEDDVVVTDNVDSKDYSTYRPYRDYPYSFSVRITNEYGCQVMAPQYYVSVNDTIEVEITATETEICETGTVTLTASLEDWNADELIYRWYTVVNGVETEIDGATNKSYTVTLNADGAHTFRFRAHQLTSLCTATDDITINVYDRPVVTLALMTDPNICDGGRVVIDATTTGGVAGGEVYTWFRDRVLIEGATGPQLIDFPRAQDGDPTDYYYQAFVIQTATGCTSDITNELDLLVTVYPNPTVFVEGDAVVCQTLPNVNNITLKANVVDNAGQTLTYQWFENNVAITDVTSDEPTLTLNKQYREYPYYFHVVISNGFGCQVASEIFEVTVMDNIVLELTATELDICAGGNSTLTAHLGDWNADMLTYRWSTVDGGVVTPINGATSLTYNTGAILNTTTYQFDVAQLTSGCLAAGQITINVHPIPVIDEIFVSERYICSGGQVSVTATPNVNNLGVLPVYTWYRNGVEIVGVTGPTFFDSPLAVDADPTDFTYNAIVRYENSGCVSVYDINLLQTLTVYGNPRVGIAGDANICQTDSVFLTAYVDHISDNVGVLYYTWYESGQRRDNGAYEITDPKGQFYAEYWPPRFEPYRFQVEATRENGCTTMSDVFELTVHTAPVVNITATETIICEGGEVTLTANLNDMTTEHITYQWFSETYNEYDIVIGGILVHFIDTILMDIPGATDRIYNPTNILNDITYGVSINQTHSNCTVSDRIKIYTTPIPVVTFPSQNVNNCVGDIATFTAGTTIDGTVVNNATYAWFINDVLVPGVYDGQFTPTFDHAGTYTISVISTVPISGCVSFRTDVATIVVEDKPVISITGTSVVCSTTGTIELEAVVEVTPIVTYQWFLNGNPVGTNSASYDTNIQIAGTYNFQVHGTTANGCTKISEIFTVNVYANPLVNIYTDRVVICDGDTTILYANIGADPATTFQWFLDKEEINGATDIYYKATLPGEYLFVATNGVCEYTSNAIVITVNEIPEALTLKAIDTQICEGDQILLEVEEPLQEGAIYTWYHNGAQIEETALNFLLVHPTAGDNKYQVTITVEGCTSEFSNEVETNVEKLPAVHITGTSLVCSSTGRIELVANTSVTPVTDYQWFLNGVVIPDATAITFDTLINIGGTYNFQVKVTTANECWTMSAEYPVVVNPQPLVNIYTDKLIMCEGDTSIIYANAGTDPATTFAWFRNDVVIDGATQNWYAATLNGIYTFTATNGECVATSNSIVITTNPVPNTPTLVIDDATICLGDQIVLTTDSVAGAVYTWYENGIIFATNALHKITVIPVLGNSDYQVTVTLNNCTSDLSNEVSVDVDGGHTVVLGGKPIICDGTNVMLTANVTPVAGDYTYNWKIDGATVATTLINEYSELMPDNFFAYMYTVEVINNETSCVATSVVYPVLVNANPVVVIEVDNNAICVGGQVTLKANLGNWNADQLTYQWYKDGIAIPEATSITYTTTLAATATFTFQVIQLTSDCDITSNQITVTVEPIPYITLIETTNTEVCDGGQVTLTANVSAGIVGGEVFTWYENGSIIPNATLSEITRNPMSVGGNAVQYIYNVTVKQTAVNCESLMDDTKAVTINARPIPTVVVEVVGHTTICEGGVVTLIANPTPDIALQNTYQWYLNGVAITGANAKTYVVQNMPANYLPYEYYVAINNGAGCDAISETEFITVKTDPTAIVTVDVPAICEGGNATFTVAVAGGVENIHGLGAYQYQWNVNGAPVAGANATAFNFVPAAFGTYNVTVDVVAIDFACNTIGTYNGFIVVTDPGVTVDVAAGSPLQVCPGGVTTLKATVNGGVGTYNYQWFKNGNLIVGATNHIIVTDPLYMAYPAVYSVIITTNVSGCQSTNFFNANAIIVEQPDVIVTASQNTTCPGAVVTLTSTITGGVYLDNYTYQWYKNGSAIEGANAATYTTEPTALAAVYEYKVVVSSFVSACSSESGAVTINVVANPTVVVTGPASICHPTVLPVVLHAQVSGGVVGASYQYIWSYVQGTNNFTYPPIYDAYFTIPGNLPASDYATPYYFTVTVVNAAVNCEGTSTMHEVSILTKPTVQITLDNSVICLGGVVNATAFPTPTATPENPYNYIWKLNGNTLPNNAPDVVLASFVQQGVNTVAVEIERSYASQSCFGNVTKTFTVIALPTLTIAQNIAGEQLPGMCVGGMANLAVTDLVYDNTLIVNTISYEWKRNGATLLEFTGATASQQLPTVGTYGYAVRATLNNGIACTSIWNDFTPIKVIAQPTVSIHPFEYYKYELCAGAEVALNFTVPNGADPILAIADLDWNRNLVLNNGAYRETLYNPGDFTYNLVVDFDNPTCNNATSNNLSYKVVPNPTWSANSVQPDPSTGLCLGESVQLTAAYQGGVTDGSDMGKIQWKYSFNAGTPVDVPGVGGIKSHKPGNIGDYVYFSTYIPVNPATGCHIADWVWDGMRVYALPSAEFLNTEQELTLCMPQLGEPVTLKVKFDGEAPYSFKFTGTDGTNRSMTAPTNNLDIIVNPTVTTTYQIENLIGLHGCMAPAHSMPSIKVTLTEANLAQNIVTTCGESATFEVLLTSGLFTSNTAILQFVDNSAFNASVNIIQVAPKKYAITYNLPVAMTPGTYDVNIHLGNCSFAAKLTLFAKPTATFVNTVDELELCNFMPNTPFNLKLQFTGVAPFTFKLIGTDGSVADVIAHTHNYEMVVYPEITCTYQVQDLTDANGCFAIAIAALTINLQAIELVENNIEICGNVAKFTLLINAGTFTETTGIVQYVDFPQFNTTATIRHISAKYYAFEFNLPAGIHPGSYDMKLHVAICDFPASILVNENNAENFIVRRWDDVLVVNNNPLTNGNYDFTAYQWYKDGVAIPGAVYQYYQQAGGIKGNYSVKLTGTNPEGRAVSFSTCELYFETATAIKIYPVPAQANEPITVELNLSPSEVNGAILDIYDAQGAHVQQVQVTSSTFTVQGIPTQGTYFGRITTGTNEIKSVKFVIVK